MFGVRSYLPQAKHCVIKNSRFVVCLNSVKKKNNFHSMFDYRKSTV